MTIKITNFNRGLDEIERIDSQIEKILETENYLHIIEIMKERLSVISQLTKIRETSELSPSMRLRLDKIFNSAASIQEKVKIKQMKITKRLGERKKIKTQNKKIAY